MITAAKWGAVIFFHLRDTDIVGRLGSDEFDVTCPHTSAAGGTYVARGLLEAVRCQAQTWSDLACQFSLDDPGSGFGPFHDLKHAFGGVKIDGDFVKDRDGLLELGAVKGNSQDAASWQRAHVSATRWRRSSPPVTAGTH